MHETTWFRLLIVAGGIAILWALHLLRVRALTRQGQRFRETIDSMPAMAYIMLPNGVRTFLNRQLREYTGLATDTRIAIAEEAVVHRDDAERVRANWQRAFATGEPLEHEVRIRRRSDGTYRWFLTRAVPIRDAHGQVVRWSGVSTDIEERKQAEHERDRLRALEAELAHVNRVNVMGELTASVTHEITQPITAIVANASAALRWLDRDQPDLVAARRSIGRMLEDGARVADMVDRLRSVYKKAPIQREPCDVNVGIQDVIALIDGEACRHRVSIRTALTPDLPVTTADRVQLRQVILNLTLNAIDAMKASGGELTVTSALDEHGDVRCTVSDTGIGIPIEHEDKIFNAFFTTKPQGTGMGLAICRSIIESHGGHLWAKSNKGPGATFQFTLPTMTADVSRDPQPRRHAYQLGQ